MRFLSVADRELRSAARQKATYRARWLTAALFFGLLVWLLWVFDALSNKRVAPEVFRIYSVLTLLHCLFLGTARTADCISVERREGTLGLLFLTNLNSAEIIAGKLCSTALASVYGLLAIFPMLALPLLLGGTSFECFAHTVLGLLNGILFALAAGFLSSVLCKRQFTAIALALGLTVAAGGGLMLAAAAADSYGPTKPFANWLAVFSPLYTLLAADRMRFFGANLFWPSAAVVAGLSVGGLGLATIVLARIWRDQPKSRLAWNGWRISRQPSEQAPSASRAELRRRLLDINPLFWLAARERVSAPVFMCLTVGLTLLTVYVAAPFFGRTMRVGTASPVAGHMFAWLWAGLCLHALVLYYAATTASQRLAEDKQTGALELILSTPTTERTISRGLWLAYARRMFFPALLAVLVHLFFIWLVLELMTMDPPGQLPPGVTPGELFRCALLDEPLAGQRLDWQFGFILRIPLLVLLQLMVTWPTIGWVARWLGLRMKHPGLAPIASLLLLFAPPVLLFSLACYLAAKFNLSHLPVRQFLPMMMWVALTIGLGHCLVLSVWAATRLRDQLRSVAMSRYQPLPPWRWRLPSGRTVWRYAAVAAGFVGVLASLVFGYYGYQTWRGRHSWRTFQATLSQRGESLSLAPLLPGPVPDGANFARSPAFDRLLSNTKQQTRRLFEGLGRFELQASAAQGNVVLLDWSRQASSPLHQFVTWTNRPSGGPSVPPRVVMRAPPYVNRMRTLPAVAPETNRKQDAALILQHLQPQAALLRELAEATAGRPAFQTTTNRDAHTVLQPAGQPVLMLERLHLLFQVRACAALELGQTAQAQADVLAGLRLARLAGQSPDSRATLRVQELLGRSLQPIWEGLGQHAWTDPELAVLQHELAGFDLLADYTNALRRVVLAYIEIWRTIPEGASPEVAPRPDGGIAPEGGWQLQPRTWWFDSCIQLHNAGWSAIEAVDAASGRVREVNIWMSINDLPLDATSRELLQEAMWWGPNPGAVAFAQTSVNQAIIACALERFRLAHRFYPEALEELVPSLLPRVPHDAVSGRPMIYQPPGAGSLILRGVGPNGVDDRKNSASDDWLWTYSTNAPSAKP